MVHEGIALQVSASDLLYSLLGVWSCVAFFWWKKYDGLCTGGCAGTSNSSARGGIILDSPKHARRLLVATLLKNEDLQDRAAKKVTIKGCTAVLVATAELLVCVLEAVNASPTECE